MSVTSLWDVWMWLSNYFVFYLNGLYNYWSRGSIHYGFSCIYTHCTTVSINICGYIAMPVLMICNLVGIIDKLCTVSGKLMIFTDTVWGMFNKILGIQHMENYFHALYH